MRLDPNWPYPNPDPFQRRQGWTTKMLVDALDLVADGPQYVICLVLEARYGLSLLYDAVDIMGGNEERWAGLKYDKAWFHEETIRFTNGGTIAFVDYRRRPGGYMHKVGKPSLLWDNSVLWLEHESLGDMRAIAMWRKAEEALTVTHDLHRKTEHISIAF